MTEKKCPKCGEIKKLEMFSCDKSTKSGHRNICKECDKIKTQAWRVKNPEKKKAADSKWSCEHPEKKRASSSKWYYKHPAESREKTLRWHRDNPEKAREKASRWYYKNHAKVKETAKKYNAKILGTERGKLNNNMRSRIGTSLKNHSKSRQHWESLVGYTVDQLKKHLEKQFTPEMSWENYGKVWEIDHKIPIAVFNYERPNDIDFRICWSINNLQPLTTFKNRSKQDKIDKPFQPSLAMAI